MLRKGILLSDMAPASGVEVTGAARASSLDQAESWLGICFAGNVWATLAFIAPMLICAVVTTSWFTKPYASSSARKACHLQIIVRFIQHISYTLVIPRSYTFGLSIGKGLAHSGLLMEVHQFGFCGGSLLMWLLFRYRPDFWKFGFFVLRLSVGFNLLGSVAFCVLAFVVEGRAAILQETAFLVLSARFIDGFGTGLNAFFGLMSIIHLIPSAERPQWMGANQFGIMFAIGLGPMLSSLAAEFNTCHVESQPLGLLGVAYVGIALTSLSLVLFLFPRSCDGVEDQNPPVDPPETAHPLDTQGWEDQPIRTHAEQTAALCGVVVMASLRAFVTSGLLAATSRLLESHYRWGEASTGVALASCFMFAIPFKIGYHCWQAKFSPVSWIRLWSMIAVIASICLHTRFFTADQGAGVWVLLGADAVLFPSLFFSDTMVGGLSLKAENLLPEGSWLGPNNMVLFRLAGIALLGRNLGAPLAQMVLEKGGQDIYAVQQLLAAILFVLLFEVLVVPSSSRSDSSVAKS